MYATPSLRGIEAPPTLQSALTQMDGFTYERSAIEQWLKIHNTSPATGAELESKQLIPNYHLRSLILDFHEARKRTRSVHGAQTAPTPP